MTSATFVPLIDITPEDGQPLYRQLYSQVRKSILDGSLHPGTQLPPSRTLANELGISRNTVIGAFDQLLAEGYLETRQGAGTFVVDLPPDLLLTAAPPDQKKPKVGTSTEPRLSKRGQRFAATQRIVASDRLRHAPAFQTGRPALEEFPFTVWNRLIARHGNHSDPAFLNYAFTAGLPALREAIAAYVGATRAVKCQADQVIVTSGAQGALDLCARLLTDAGDKVWIEDPGYIGARAALVAAGTHLVPVPIDREGISIERGIQLSQEPKLIYVTPSHQYPLGITMSLERRLQLLEISKRTGAWIIEDDYANEYRYEGRPLSSLQGLDEEAHVIYVGTFSKITFPALKVGYAIVPKTISAEFENAQRQTGQSVPTLIQAALSDFISEGGLASHVRRMRTLYDSRRRLLIDHVERELDGYLHIGAADGGMHVCGHLGDEANDTEIAEKAKKEGLFLQPLSYFSIAAQGKGFPLGFAGVPEKKIAKGVKLLATLIRSNFSVN